MVRLLGYAFTQVLFAWTLKCCTIVYGLYEGGHWVKACRCSVEVSGASVASS